MHLKSALTASAGGALDWYDFVIIGTFASVLGEEFFPKDNVNIQNLLVFMVFASGYIARPLGALIFGHIGDKYGRKKSLYYSMILSGISALILAIIPGYKQIGITASIIFIIVRVLQGFTVGGSTTGAMVYVSEMIPKNKLCFWMTQVISGVNRGWILASFVSFILFHVMSKHSLHQWGWRLAFVTGTVVMLVAVYFKKKLPESKHHEIIQESMSTKHLPLFDLIKKQYFRLIAACGVCVLFSSLTMVLLVYLPSFFNYYNVPEKYIVDINLMSSLSFAIALPVFGMIGDKIGPRFMLVCSSSFLILMIESCARMLSSHKPIMLYFGAITLSIMTASVVAATPSLLVSLFPTNTRNTGVGFSYNMVGSIVAFAWPVIIPFLNRSSGSVVYTGTILLVISAVITLITCILLRNKKDYLQYYEYK